MQKSKYLSYIISENSPSYGNRERVELLRLKSIKNGNTANDSKIEMSVHIGTHIDMPYHFYEKGQTIKDFESDFFVFSRPLIVEIKPKNLIIKNELIDVLTNHTDEGYDIIIVKTGICDIRGTEDFWSKNYGFDPSIYGVLKDRFPNVRAFGFDSISISSFQHGNVGKEAHKKFLNPINPIILIEDMDLRSVKGNDKFEKVIVLPLRIDECDGLPCTIIGLT